jgi:hydroxypyruvate isomerase
MPRLAANQSLMFSELAFLDRFAVAGAADFQGVEFLFPCDWPAKDIRVRLNDAGLVQVLFNISAGDFAGGERGLTALAGREDDFARALHQALDYALVLACSQLHAMSGLVAHGAQRGVLETNLAKASDLAAPTGVDVLIEAINAIDMPGYFFTHRQQAADIIAAVGAPNFGLQFDLYHRHRVEGDAAGAIDCYAGIIRHYQIAGPPDRG